MNQFDWSGKVGGAPYFAPSCDQDDGLVEAPWSCGHVVMQSQGMSRRLESGAVHEQHEVASPWFPYPVIDREAEKDLFSEIFGEMTTVAAGSDTAGYSTPRGEEASDAMSGHDASTTVMPRGKRERRDTSESPDEVLLGVEESQPGVATTLSMRGKRRRAAEEHNFSERRRRDRINQKMRALQELIPNCNKTDKASMLDEAIDYLKSLQVQVQVMSTMGGGMAPVMFPPSGTHHYMRRLASRMPPFRT